MSRATLFNSVRKMTKEDIYYYCTTCGHVHLRNSEIGKLHVNNSFKIQKQKIEMEDASKGLGAVDTGLEKKIIERKMKRIYKRK